MDRVINVDCTFVQVGFSII